MLKYNKILFNYRFPLSITLFPRKSNLAKIFTFRSTSYISILLNLNSGISGTPFT